MLDRLADALREMIGTECTVEFRKVDKNNGLVLQAVVIREPGMNVCPTIYIDSLLEGIRNRETSLHDAAEEIAGIYRESRNVPFAQDIVSKLGNKEYILENVAYKIINLEKNRDRLADMPHKVLLDMAAVYIVAFKGKHMHETSSFTINRQFCDNLAISETELDDAAKRNTERNGFRVQSMESVLAEIGCIPETTAGQGDGMWIISTPGRFNGASVMLYGSSFGGLAEKLGSDLYVLPSSIHEVLAIPVGKIKPDNLRDMVRDVNSSDAVAVDEVLSNSIYRYSRKTGTLAIV